MFIVILGSVLIVVVWLKIKIIYLNSKSLYCQVDINYFKPTTAHIQSSVTLNEEGNGNNNRNKN